MSQENIGKQFLENYIIFMRNFKHFRKKLQKLFSPLVPIPGKIRGT